MTWLPISQTVPQYVDNNGDPYSGAVLKFYSAGTSTNISLATDNSGGTTATSVALNAAGYPEVSGSVIIPHLEEAYKIILYPTQTAADSDTGALWTIDDITPAIIAGTNTDINVKVSSNDTTAGYLNGKLVAGANVTLTEGSDGGNETLTIALNTGFQDGHLFGLGTSGDSTTEPGGIEHDILVAVGSCVDSTNAFSMSLTTAITKRIDAGWGAGDDQGGFPSGLSLSADTTYHFFLIAKTDGTVDAGWDTNLDASELLSDASAYTYYRRIASHVTDSSSNITSYTQFGDEFILSAPVNDLTTTDMTAVAVSQALSVPLGIEVLANITARLNHSSSAIAWVHPLEVADYTPTNALATLRVTGGSVFSSTDMRIKTNTSGEIHYRGDTATADFDLITRGWTDTRGQ